MTEISEKEIDAALQELLHDRNSQGDNGCFGCGSTAHWGPTQIHSRIPFYRDMLKRVLEASKQAVAVTPRQKPAITSAPATPPAQNTSAVPQSSTSS